MGDGFQAGFQEGYQGVGAFVPPARHFTRGHFVDAQWHDKHFLETAEVAVETVPAAGTVVAGGGWYRIWPPLALPAPPTHHEYAAVLELPRWTVQATAARGNWLDEREELELLILTADCLDTAAALLVELDDLEREHGEHRR